MPLILCWVVEPSKIALTVKSSLPNPEIEGAVAELVVVPDCIGNRGFCVDFRTDPSNGNCMFPSQSIDDIVQAVFHAVATLANKSALSVIALNAQKTLLKHGLERERRAFLKIMNKSAGLWKEIK